MTAFDIASLWGAVCVKIRSYGYNGHYNHIMVMILIYNGHDIHIMGSDNAYNRHDMYSISGQTSEF